MNPFRTLWLKLRSLGQRRAVKQEIDEELRFHIEQRTAENVAAGMSAEEAAREARKRFGNFQAVREQCREKRGATFGDTTLQDLRFGLRMLRKNPGFSAVAVVTLALGIGANMTIFSVISSMFFQPLPVKEPERLVLVLQKSAVWNMLHGHSWLDFRDYQKRVDAFAGVLATMLNPVHLSMPGQQPERAWIEAVSADYFSMLGVRPKLGQFFRGDEDDAIGRDAVAVLSHQFWQRAFGGDAGVIGRTMIINGHPFTIIGIAPPTFQSAQWSMDPAAFVPASMLGQIRSGGEDLLVNRNGEGAFTVMARLQPGVPLKQARASVGVVAAQLAHDFPDAHRQARVFVIPERFCRPIPAFSELMPLVGSVFMALVFLVLLIACANVANLMFARAAVRQRELGIRAAVGATRWRLLRQLLSESVTLALLAGAGGGLAAFWSAGFIAGFNPSGDVPTRMERHWDWRVFLFAFGVSVVAGVVTGLAPAWRATKIDPQTTLKEPSAGLLAARGHAWRAGFVILQVAISVLVLTAGGLFVRSLQQAARLDLGFRTDHLLMASLDLGLQGYDQEKQKLFYHDLTSRLKALPGARSASLAHTVPFDYAWDIVTVAAEEKGGGKENFIAVNVNHIDCDYLAVMGTALLRGRNFTEQDTASAPGVAVVNGVLAERLWPGQDPLGRRFRWGAGGSWLQVVGVARNSKCESIGEDPRPVFYVPLTQSLATPITLHVWTEGDPAAMVSAVRDVITQMDPLLPLYNVRSISQHVHDSVLAMMPLRMAAMLATTLGLLGAVLAVMGLYGVVSYVVIQRTREMGIRIALGAQRRDIFQLVIRDGLKLTVIGLAIGLLCSLGLNGVFSRILYGLTPGAAPVFVVVVALLVSVALLACWLPARRATKVDPMTALRYE